MFKVTNEDTRKTSLRSFWCLHYYLWTYIVDYLNYFKSFPSFPIVHFEQLNICWENYLTFNSFDICFNVSTGWRQDLTRSNAANSVFFVISHTQWDLTFASLRLLKKFIQWTLESLYKCDHQFFGNTKLNQDITVNPLPQIIFHFRKP